MTDHPSYRISLLLEKWGGGDKGALEELMPLVYDELRRMARNVLRGQQGNTFQTTELLHETYLKLAKGDEHKWQNRGHFFGVAAKAMRHIMVDYARSKLAQKRGGPQIKLSLAENIEDTHVASSQVVALEEALDRLANLDERKGRIVEMKFFGGLTNEETAEILGVSVETVKRDWRFARAWLLHELEGRVQTT